MGKIAVIDGFRTPFCKAESILKDTRPDFLGALAVKEMIQRMRNWEIKTSQIEFVVGSNVATPPHAPNIARVAAAKGGLPESIPAQTLSQNCGSGIAAVDYGRNLIELGRYNTVLVVGVESMSQIPFIYSDEVKKEFLRLSETKFKSVQFKILLRLYPKLLKFWDKKYQPIAGLFLGLTDPVCDLIMGLTAENLAKDPCFGITRQDQDFFAVNSNQKASLAQQQGIFSQEIFGLYIPGKNKHAFIDSDNGIRADQESISRSKPYFDKHYGTVTPGNSSQITDGAACILLMNRHLAKSLGLPTMGYIGQYEQIGFDPTRMGLSPVGAIAKLLKKTRLTLKNFSTIEINEAFAAQVLACIRTLASEKLMTKWFGSYGLTNSIGEINPHQLNPNGGAIALGHPVGVSGMRLVITALKELERRQGEKSLVSACIGGGQANAMILEREAS